MKAEDAKKIISTAIDREVEAYTFYRTISDKVKDPVLKKLFDELAPALAGRNGGYTRILKLGKRVGDAAETCLLQVIRDEAAPAPEKAVKAEKKTSKKKEVKAE